MVNLACVMQALRRVVLVAVIAAAGQVGTASRTTHAEERAAIVNLSYVRGYSNWGPANAYGTARFWPQEGVATLSLHNLPKLPGGDRYESWIVNTTSGEALGLGSFNSTDAGDAEQDVIFSQPMPRGSNAFLVTIVHAGDPPTQPGPERAIAGYFPPVSGPAIAPPQQPKQSGGTAHHTGHINHSKGAAAPVGRGSHGQSSASKRSGHQIVELPTTGRPRRRGHAPHPIVALPQTGGGPCALQRNRTRKECQHSGHGGGA